MAIDRFVEVDERISCAFVLSSSLYFRLAVFDRHARNPSLAIWHGLLHDTSCDLSALSDGWNDRETVPRQMARGVADLLESLRDVSDMACRTCQPQLSAELRAYADRLEARIDLSR